MTLGDLLRKLREVGDQFNTYEIPLINGDWDDVDFQIEVAQDSETKQYYVKVIEIVKYEGIEPEVLERFKRRKK